MAHGAPGLQAYVALRKESVDRNYPPGPPSFLYGASLSARRAWIEIGIIMGGPGMMTVALRKESVDRNRQIMPLVDLQTRRSPQGERG